MILGLRGLSFEPERTDFGPERADFGLKRAELGPERGLGGQMNGRTDRWTDRQTGGRLEIHPCPTGHRPFGAATQKRDRPTNQPTGCRVERKTNKASSETKDL